MDFSILNQQTNSSSFRVVLHLCEFPEILKRPTLLVRHHHQEKDGQHGLLGNEWASQAQSKFSIEVGKCNGRALAVVREGHNQELRHLTIFQRETIKIMFSYSNSFWGNFQHLIDWLVGCCFFFVQGEVNVP